ncbi:MAG: AAA family ATPase [Acidaminococcaceae bacterium]|nr:AAA family ATPase [Acidaminococcaceae bacterium]
MRLLSLELKNFKGHKSLDVHFGDITKIIGANGTGKTSIFDAFCFVLTGKDSLGRVCGTGQKGEATIRPRKADGDLVHEVEVSVTAKLVDEDGEVHTLQRIFCEEYGTSKSSGQKFFKGNTTKYFINEVPLAAGKYDAWIKEHLDPERFNLTSNPAFFPMMHWQDQRKWLLQISGDVDDMDVIATDPELRPLENLIARHTVEDVKAMAANQLKLANKTIKEDMVRIDQTAVLAGNAVEADLEAQITRQDEMVKAQDETVAQAEAELANARNGDRAAQVQNKLDAQKNIIENWEMRRHNKIIEIKNDFKAKAAALQATMNGAEESVKSKRQQLASLSGQIKEAEDRREELYQKYDAEDAKQFSDAAVPLCQFCHQALPTDKVEKLRAQFNTDKARSLESIVADGKKLTARIEDLKGQQSLLSSGISADEQSAVEIRKQLDGIHEAEKAELEKLPQLEDVAEFRNERAKRDMLARELANLQKGEQPNLAPLQANVDEARKIRDSLLVKRSELQTSLKTLQAIADLKNDLQKQRENADTASATLRMASLFIQTKCRMLTDKVNQLFPGLEWRLFMRNIGNDDIVETCELTMHGTPYRDLSAGEKIKAGLIIVDTLQEKLEVQNPVFVDGAESITFTPEVKSQLVLLKAEENTELKCELEA